MKAKKEKMFGFGHRVYRNFDPRAKIIKEVRAIAARVGCTALQVVARCRLVGARGFLAGLVFVD